MDWYQRFLRRIDAWAVYLDPRFSGDRYRLMNPEVPLGRLGAAQHWVWHGFSEGRFASDHPFCHAHLELRQVVERRTQLERASIEAFYEALFAGDFGEAGSILDTCPTDFADLHRQRSQRRAALGETKAEPDQSSVTLAPTEEAIRRYQRLFGDRQPGTAGDVGLILPDADLLSGGSPLAEHVLGGFRLLIAALTRRGMGIVPLPSVWPRDLAQVQAGGLPMISYHTHAEGRQDILHFKETAFSGQLFLDRNGFSGAARIEIDDGTHWEDNFQAASKYSQTDTRFVPRRPFVFIACQVSDDYSSRWHYLSLKQILATSLEVAEALDMDVVCKPHPFERLPITRRALEESTYERLMVTTDNVRSLIDQCEVVVTGNSGVGLEALAAGQRVIACGESEYSQGAPVAKSQATLKACLESILVRSIWDDSRRRGFLAAFVKERCFSADDDAETFDRGPGRYLDQFLNENGLG